MIEYETELQEQVNKVIKYSQKLIKTDSSKLLQQWAHSKSQFYNLFGNNLIYEYGPVTCHYPDDKKIELFAEFLRIVQHDFYEYVSTDFILFLKMNEKKFFENKVSNAYEIDNKIIPIGMKLSRAFKYFFKSKEILDEVQTLYSQVIQNEYMEGTLCFSIHPLDYLSSSENNYKWHSCHALDGEYRGGNLSYMVDSSTIVCYIKGSNEAKLPNFPEDVKWNDKKWRMLLFTNKNYDTLFAGRQYPFTLSEDILTLVKHIFLKLIDDNKKPLFRYGDVYSEWYNDIISKYTYKSGDINSTYLRNNYIVIDDQILPIDQVVQEAPGNLAYNDLLHSSCYTPYYAWKHFTYGRKQIEVGGSPICPCCNERVVENSSLLTCYDCDNAYGLERTKCACCGNNIINEDDMTWIDSEERYVCESCLIDFYEECSCCGNYCERSEMSCVGGDYYCEDCNPEYY